MLETLLESLDKEVFTEDAIEAIKLQFNEAVQSKADEIAQVAIEEAEKALEEKTVKYTEEIIAEKEAALEENSKAYIEQKMNEMNESLDLFMESVVEEFLVQSKAQLNESLKAEKSDMIIEAFESMITAGSMELVKIAEAKDQSEAETKLAESITKIDALMVESLELKKQNLELIKTGIIAEMKAGLSLVESKKFEDLATMIPFSRDEKFVEQLEIIKESVKGTPEKVEEVLVTESVVENKPSTKVDYSHLV